MTYRQLLNQLQALSQAQLDYNVTVMGLDNGNKDVVVEFGRSLENRNSDQPYLKYFG